MKAYFKRTFNNPLKLEVSLYKRINVFESIKQKKLEYYSGTYVLEDMKIKDNQKIIAILFYEGKWKQDNVYFEVTDDFVFIKDFNDFLLDYKTSYLNQLEKDILLFQSKDNTRSFPGYYVKEMLNYLAITIPEKFHYVSYVQADYSYVCYGGEDSVSDYLKKNITSAINQLIQTKIHDIDQELEKE